MSVKSLAQAQVEVKRPELREHKEKEKYTFFPSFNLASSLYNTKLDGLQKLGYLVTIPLAFAAILPDLAVFAKDFVGNVKRFFQNRHVSVLNAKIDAKNKKTQADWKAAAAKVTQIVVAKSGSKSKVAAAAAAAADAVAAAADAKAVAKAAAKVAADATVWKVPYLGWEICREK